MTPGKWVKQPNEKYELQSKKFPFSSVNIRAYSETRDSNIYHGQIAVKENDDGQVLITNEWGEMVSYLKKK